MKKPIKQYCVFPEQIEACHYVIKKKSLKILKEIQQ